ncbi:hypothetical protein [Sphingomonas sanxanigenens]|uniref:Uncharacterized protein n=1 Tax=Sphingomonas sanxanigenens DSM 19645 = NX02 TaxID=1123269 RepID=W0A6F8_9SPHN|nr:hypothetical protein [Sphingomonas sanxanigenens]AHE52646.1 hypothetical protein NX02_04510 [Sphingomonas sanxanigenens DSM 19645 = NX02]
MADIRKVQVRGLRGPGLSAEDTAAINAAVEAAEGAAEEAGAKLGEITDALATGLAAIDAAVEDAEEAAASIPLYTSPRLAAIEDALGLPAVPPEAPFHDSFAGGAGLLKNRPGYIVLTQSGFAAQVDSLSVGDGFIGGTTGTSAWGLKTTDSVTVWVDRIIGVAPITYLVDHVTVSPLLDRFRAGGTWTVVGGLNTGNYTISRIDDSSSPSSVQQLGNLRVEAFDVVSHRFEEPAPGTITLTVCLNGRQAGPPVVVSGLGVPFTMNHGITGNAGAQALRWIQIAKPATQALITLFAPNRVVHRNVDGSTTWRLRGQYTGDAPRALRYLLLDHAAGVAVSGHSNVLVNDLVAENGWWSGWFTISNAASLAVKDTGVRLFVRRRGLIDENDAEATADAWGPIQYPGEVSPVNGQSLGVQEGRQVLVTAGLYPAPARSFWIDGEPSTMQPEAFYRRQLPITADTTVAAFAGVVQALTGTSVATCSGGVSSTAIIERTVGTPGYIALRDAIEHAGGAGILRHIDGQSDIGTSDADYETVFLAIYTALIAEFPDLRVLMVPCSSAWAAGVGNYNRIRRLQWDIARRRTDICVGLGAYSNGVQKLDTLHKPALGYAEISRRNGHCYRQARGYQQFDGNGPWFAAFSKVSSSRLRGVFNLGRGDSLALNNSGYGGDFAGAMQFATASTFASPIAPTAFTIDASPVDIGGGVLQQGIEWDFAGTPFAGAAFARAAIGDNPYNLANNATINADLVNRASMIVALKAGEPSVEMQPYYSPDGNDYRQA